MNVTKTIVLSLLATVVVVIGYVTMTHRPTGPRNENVVPAPPTVAIAPTDTTASQTPAIESGPSAVVAESGSAASPPRAPKKIIATKSPKPARVKPPIQDPDARAALSLVGADPQAEQYWLAAINDPNLPADERKDLIEDLNEDGLSNPKRPSPQDLPLIANRLRLIEELAPLAMDQINADAFAEAYKDLQNLAAGGTAQ
jgi:hypothetical protein